MLQLKLDISNLNLKTTSFFLICQWIFENIFDFLL